MLSSNKPALLLAALALIVAGVAGCGDDPQTTTTVTPMAPETTATQATGAGTGSTAAEPPADVDPDAKTPERAATAFLVSADDELVCGELIAPQLLGPTYGDLAACREGRPPQSLAKSAEVEDSSEQDGKATITLVPEGGVYDGVPVEFELNSDGAGWIIVGVEADVPVGP